MEIANMDSKIETQVNWTGTWIREYQRGREEECPEQVRLGREITKLLIKRETKLADALDALTTVLLNALGAKYGERDEFYRFYEQVSMFLGSTERDRAVVGWIPKRPDGGLLMKSRRLIHRLLAARAQPRTVTMVEERPERVRRLDIEVGELITKLRPSSLGVGFDALTSTMLTAIEATRGRERADEFDLLMGRFSKEVIQKFSRERVQ
jgi:hypothetical protein